MELAAVSFWFFFAAVCVAAGSLAVYTWRLACWFYWDSQRAQNNSSTGTGRWSW